MKRTPHYQLHKSHPARNPSWRWDRASNLVQNGRNFSKMRDDLATGIAVRYVREVAKSFSANRLRRIKSEFQHIVTAQEIWQEAGSTRLELECRILSRQTSTAIHFEIQLPAESVQAYRDLFYHVDDRIGADRYILYTVVGIDPCHTPSEVQLMQ